ncbi:Protein GIR2 [Wickerhamiella sorbophila]|uniref:Protein GIR2 n=1 Tax=Wickerhamiella sorbophila TaxID=45607 RepID=A0A2T0FLR1_9ASCO|nr:Protein GIR2 [Wickerhamiella sorbophila]PRT55907.1 Protein GIR2 [Wickerhamiella sorbophila]
MSEEQREEIDILESIYPDEIEIHSETSYSINLSLDTVPTRLLVVHVQYPRDYPEVVPILDIAVGDHEQDSDEEEEQRAVEQPQFTYDFTSSDVAELKASAKETAEENLGMPSVFAIVSLIKDAAEQMYEDRIKDMELARMKELEIAEEKEQAKFRGTPVTAESFAAWRTKFRAEMGWDQKKERPNGRLSGKEIFERGVEEEADEEEDED